MIEIRDAGELDRAFVLSTWVESEEDHSGLPGSRDEVFCALRGKARALLDRSRVLVASPEGDAVTVLAWAAVEGPRVHYAYTRRAFRGRGLVHSLLDAAGFAGHVVVTCAPPRRGAKSVRIRFDPRLGWMLACASERAA